MKAAMDHLMGLKELEVRRPDATLLSRIDASGVCNVAGLQVLCQGHPRASERLRSVCHNVLVSRRQGSLRERGACCVHTRVLDA